MKEHLNDYEKRIWEGIDKDAEEIIKMVEADPEAMSAEPSEEMDRKIYAMTQAMKMQIRKIRRWRACQKKTRRHYVWAESYRSGEKRKKRKNPEQKDDITGSGLQLRQQYWCLR